jgi:hypothetical protein
VADQSSSRNRPATRPTVRGSRAAGHIDSAFEETLRRRLRDTLDGVEGPDPVWATSPARREVQAGHGGFPVWRSLAAIAAGLLVVAAGVTMISLPKSSSAASAAASGLPAASQEAPSYAPSGAPSGGATSVAPPAPSASAASASPSPSASPTATLGPCPSLSGRTPDPLMCLTCRCETPSPTAGG